MSPYKSLFTSCSRGYLQVCLCTGLHEVDESSNVTGRDLIPQSKCSSERKFLENDSMIEVSATFKEHVLHQQMSCLFNFVSSSLPLQFYTFLVFDDFMSLFGGGVSFGLLGDATKSHPWRI